MQVLGFSWLSMTLVPARADHDSEPAAPADAAPAADELPDHDLDQVIGGLALWPTDGDGSL